MSPENECPRFKQNAWKKELCSNCFRPKEEHPEKPKRVHIDYKPLPEISPAQSILKGNCRSCDKSRNVSFSNVESEIIGYGGEEYTTDEDYSSDEEPYADHCGDPAEDEELKRLTEANTNLNGKPIAVPDKTAVACDNAVQLPKASAKPDQKKTSPPPPPPPPLVVVQPFGSAAEQPKSLVFNFLKNKEIAAAARAAAALQRADKKDAESEVQPRKTETKRPSLTRSSLVAHSNEPYLNIKRCSLPPADENRGDEPPAVPPLQQTTVEIPMVKLHPPPETTVCGAAEDTDVSARANNDADECSAAAAAAAPYKTRTNVPRMGTMHFKLKLAVTQKTTDPDPNAAVVDSAPEPPPPSSSLTSREMAGEPDGKADSDEPGDPTTTITSSANRSFLHDIKDTSTPLRDSTTSPKKTPLKKTLIAGNSPPECPRSVKRQAPKPPPPPPPPTPPSVKCGGPEPVYRRQNSAGCSSFSGDDDDDDDDGGGKPLQPTREKGRPESASPHRRRDTAAATGEAKPRESSTLPLAAKRPAAACEKKIKTHGGGRAGRVGSKIKKFLRFPSFGDVSATRPQPTPCRPKLEIIHPLDVNKSGVEIIHNAVVVVDSREPLSAAVCRGPNHHHYAAARPTKPPPPPRSHHPPVAAKPPKTLDDSCSASDEPSVNFSAPECDRGSPEMARLASLQYCGSETESEIYPPAIQFGDDFGAEDSIRNTQPGHKSLEESYDAVVVANHEALTKLLDQATSEPKVPKEFMALKTTSLELSSFHVDPTNWFNKSDCAFFNSKWYDMPVVLSISSEQVRLNNIVNNHFTLTKVAQFVSHVEKEFSPVATNEEAYITLWSAHRIETFESYCKDYNTKYTDVTKEAGLILVETVNLLMSLQTLNIDRYSLEPFIVTRNIFGEDPTIAVVQLESIFKEENTLCEVMLSVLRLLVPTWEMTVCLSQVLEQDKPNSLSKCKALLEFWLWGPTGVTVTPDRPLSLKRWLDLERANELHGHVCSRSADLSMKQICYMSFLVANDDKLFSDTWTVLAKQKMQPPCDSTISKC